MHPAARESTEVRTFLTAGANTILPQYEGVAWTQFNPAVVPAAAVAAAAEGVSGTTTAAAAVAAPGSPQAHVGSPSAGQQQSGVGPVDDMEMDDMFLGNDGAGGPHPDDDDDDDDQDDDAIPSAAIRYKPTDEAVTDQDELDILQGDVEMVEDVGSLAQSLGASHLGRSLSLQAELKYKGGQQQQYAFNSKPPVQGLTIGRSQQQPQTQGPSAGGIGGAMAMAAASSSSSQQQRVGEFVTSNNFNRKPLESAPRLDSFKMIRVIGKGSFGTYMLLLAVLVFSLAYCNVSRRIGTISFSLLILTSYIVITAGKVFLVREIKTGQIHALKVLRKDNIIKRNQVEHTRTERSVLGYVKHPFIVGMNMAFQSKDKLYFVLDYCAGGELFFHLGKEGRFPEVRARFYAAEIILAISYVHRYVYMLCIVRVLYPCKCIPRVYILYTHRPPVFLSASGSSTETSSQRMSC